jgi:hypothetical protein
MDESPDLRWLAFSPRSADADMPTLAPYMSPARTRLQTVQGWRDTMPLLPVASPDVFVRDCPRLLQQSLEPHPTAHDTVHRVSHLDLQSPAKVSLGLLKEAHLHSHQQLPIAACETMQQRMLQPQSVGDASSSGIIGSSSEAFSRTVFTASDSSASSKQCQKRSGSSTTHSKLRLPHRGNRLTRCVAKTLSFQTLQWNRCFFACAL